MSIENNIIDFNEFKKKKAEKADQSMPEQPKIDDMQKTIEQLSDEEADKFLDYYEKRGVSITEAIDKIGDFTSSQAIGNSNWRRYQERSIELQADSLETLAAKIMSLKINEMQTNPAYARALFQTFQNKLKQEMAMFSQKIREEKPPKQE